jgi:hypothetical protein
VIPGQGNAPTDDYGLKIWTHAATEPTFDEAGRATAP